ncbi:hypothetical protein ACSYAD_33175 [Acaryochloris marina NIES-2412]|uniref:hypothetical protein n=1 Tax=Acaryochloris marina TaxID=155978 RepID=UPI00405936D1
MTKTQNQNESPGWKWESVAIACFIVIAISTFVGLIALPKKEGEKLSLSFWALTIPFTISFAVVGCWLSEPREGCSDRDEKPDSLVRSSEARRETRADDPQVHTHAVLNSELDEKLASIEKEMAEIVQRLGAIGEVASGRARVNTAPVSFAEQECQARWNLMAMLSELGVDGSILMPLLRAVEICSDEHLWEHPAKYGTLYSDTERFYREEKIWPIIRDGQIEWGMRPDLDELDESLLGYEEDEPSVEQTLFRSFDCCIRCKYIAEHPCACAVVPFGCTVDPSEQCREFVSQDSDIHVHVPVPELTKNQPVEEPIFDQLAQIITAFGSPMADAEGGILYDDGTYLFMRGEHEINVARSAEGDYVNHIYRNLCLFDHQDIRGVGHNYFFDRTTAEDRAHFTQLAESIENRTQGDAELELNPAV